MARSRSRVVYVEAGGGLHSAGGRICRVRASKTGRTLYLDGMALQSLDGSGYKANYHDVASGLHYWVSNPRRDGHDRLYPGIVCVDADAREEYWTVIRERPESSSVDAFRAPGKHSKRRPHPDAHRARRR